MNIFKKTRFFLWVWGLGILIFSSCNRDIATPREAEIYVAEMGKTLSVNSEYEIKLLEVKDNRCPQNVCTTCFPNIAEITLEVKKGNFTTHFTINYQGCYIEGEEHIYQQEVEQDNLHFKFTVYSLTPYPENDENKTIKFNIQTME